ncbi:hypothetical protein PENTCL1PPCAC_16401, partial [Pristionchus entomophagus]
PPTNDPPCTLEHPEIENKKAKKVVSEYYKKQNELLENFKTDNEQILVSQKLRPRQHLTSSNSAEPEEAAAAASGVSVGAAPVLKQAERDEDASDKKSSVKRSTVVRGATTTTIGMEHSLDE